MILAVNVRTGYVRMPRTKAMATVELAMVLPIVLLLLFGIIEFGLLFKDGLILREAAAVGARAAAVGATPASIEEIIHSNLPTIDSSAVSITLRYRVWTGDGWGAWTALGTNEEGTENDAPKGAQIRVRLSYQHPLIAGSLFSWLATDQDNNTVQLKATAVARRE